MATKKKKHPLSDVKMGTPYSQISYWKNGYEQVEVNEDPPKPEEAKPFWVMWRSRQVIPVSILVFARDAKHAQRRVVRSLEVAAEKDYKDTSVQYPLISRAPLLLEQLKTGALRAFVKQLPVDKIVAHVNWASNGGIV